MKKTMSFLYILFMKMIYARIFMLKHPRKDLFLTIPNYYAFFGDTKWDFAAIFEERPSEAVSGYVLISRKGYGSKVWALDNSETLVYGRRPDGLEQAFRAIHIGKDIVAIESATGGCLQHNSDKKRFTLEKCLYAFGMEDQIFFVTDENGVWHGASLGFGIFNFLVLTDSLFTCPTCIPGGFGSLEPNWSIYSHFYPNSNYYPAIPSV